MTDGNTTEQSLLELILDAEAYERDLVERARFPVREIEPVFGRCYLAGYRRPRKVKRKRPGPNKAEGRRAIIWRQHLARTIRRGRQATARFWRRSLTNWLRPRRQYIQP
jgi:hypothetical protein